MQEMPGSVMTLSAKFIPSLIFTFFGLPFLLKVAKLGGSPPLRPVRHCRSRRWQLTLLCHRQRLPGQAARRQDAESEGRSRCQKGGAQAFPSAAPLGEGVGGVEDGGFVPDYKRRGSAAIEGPASPGRSGDGERE